jgi:hypothetical protein
MAGVVKGTRRVVLALVVLGLIVTLVDFWVLNYQRGTFSVDLYGNSWQLRPWSLTAIAFGAGVVVTLGLVLAFSALRRIERATHRAKRSKAEPAQDGGTH